MRQDRRIARLCGMVLVLAWVGCSASGRASGPEQVPERTPANGDARSQVAPPKQPVIDLTAALVPIATPQPVHILVHERRKTTGEGIETSIQELLLDLRAVLTRTGVKSDGMVQAKLAFKRIKLEYGDPDRPEMVLRYNSATGKPGQGNPLADVMACVADAEMSLTVSPAGELRELHGLDGRWRQANMIMAPPAMLTAQWLFRDIGMAELVAEALFPAMPARSVQPGDSWQTNVPANIPLAVRLDAHLSNTLRQIATDTGDARTPTATIAATGTIGPAPPIIEGETPAIRPVVKAGSVRIIQNVTPASNCLTHRSERKLEVVLTLVPPAGDERREMTIKQVRTLTAERGG